MNNEATHSRKKNWKYGLFLLIPVGMALLVWVVMLLWNTVLVPVVSGVTVVSFWQAAGILVLAKILFGGHYGSSGKRRHSRRWKQQWSELSDEEKQKFREEWHNRCGPFC